MQPWLETLGVTGLALLAIILGLAVSQLKKPWWLIGYAIPLLLLLLIALARNINSLRFTIVFSTINAGRNEFIAFACAIPMVLSILIGRLPGKRQKALMAILIAIASVQFIVYPFLVPALIRNKLSRLPTIITDDGVCLQNTDYTCGPAAAVTALARLNIEANEGELAVIARTTPQMGTPDDMLADAIEKRYGDCGIRCQYRYFDSIHQLKLKGPTIAVVKFAFLIDHYVTVLEVTDKEVIVGDPLEGKQTLTYEQFREKWRFIGITINRTNDNTRHDGTPLS